MKTKKEIVSKGLAKVKSLAELYRLAQVDPRYKSLTIVASENLGGPPSAKFEVAKRWLDTNANETTEAGVVREVNACRDLVK